MLSLLSAHFRIARCWQCTKLATSCWGLTSFMTATVRHAIASCHACQHCYVLQGRHLEFYLWLPCFPRVTLCIQTEVKGMLCGVQGGCKPFCSSR